MTPAELTDLITAEEAEKLLDECDGDDCLTCEYARTVIALHAQLADAQARGMEMALKTYRTGAGVDNGNYPLWAYDADYETAVRKKAEVHRKAASDRATRKDI